MNKNKILDVVLYSLLTLIIIFSIVLGFKFYKSKVLNNTYVINLLGSNNITVYKGEVYKEFGYNARDFQNNDATSLVKIKNNVNVNIIGRYEIVYSINTFFKKNEVKRIVNVIDNPLNDINFSLIGDDIIKINLYDSYSDLGFKCLNKNNLDCSKYVTVNSNVLTNKIGNYIVDYVLNINGKEKKITRLVEVSGPSYEYKLDKEKMVNTDVVIEFRSNINNLEYIIKPNGEIEKNDLIYYKASINDKYKFIMYDSFGISTEVIVLVDNIDKEKPTGSCKAIIDGNNTTYTINATDNNKVIKYVHELYPNDVYLNNQFSINLRIENGKVLIYDEASNFTIIECDTDYMYIKPYGNSIYEYNSDSLNYWVEKLSSNYHLIHIWMDNPYDQMKTALPSTFGKLQTAKNILNYEINNKGYNNKGLVAINGSGFVSEEFDQNFYYKIPAWKNTSVTPIVIYNGSVLRDFTNQVLPTNQYLTYGLTKDGDFKYYSFENSSDINTNQNTSRQIIDDGVKYTFGFRPVLVWNSKRIVNDSSRKYRRQAIGQIDKNNFVIISTSDISLNSIADKMISLGCYTGFNLDGGGSIALFYKDKSNNVTTLLNSGRSIADILYFVEN